MVKLPQEERVLQLISISTLSLELCPWRERLMGLNSDTEMRVPCSTRVGIKSTKSVLKSSVGERKPFGIVLIFPQANQRQVFICWVFGNVHTN